MTVIHDRFTLERLLAASPARTFRSFADPAEKVRWFSVPDRWTQRDHQLDFRVGGRELNRGIDHDGVLHEFRGVYHRIEPEHLIVFSYEMQLGDHLVSVSITTIELLPAGNQTRLTFTEQGAFFDEAVLARGREHGTRALLDRLTNVTTQRGS